MFKNRCYNGGDKHNFKPRYDEKQRDSEYPIESCNSRSMLYYEVYIHDICVWCGKIIKKDS